MIDYRLVSVNYSYRHKTMLERISDMVISEVTKGRDISPELMNKIGHDLDNLSHSGYKKMY